MATLVLYHGGCSDGYCAAWILKKVYPLAKLIPCQYGMAVGSKDPPDVTDYDVVIADFSFPRAVLLRMERMARSILLIDHHKSAEERLRGLPFCKFDMTKSGAGLVWDHYFPELLRPALVDYVEDRDIWTRKLPETDAIAAVIQSTPQELDAFDELADRMDMNLEDVIREGKSILKAHARIEERVEATKIDVAIAGFRVPSVNCSVLASEILHDLGVGMPFAACWNVTAEGRVKFSLRSEEAGEDVAKIASQFGGGGHPHSSAFEIELDHAMTMFSPRGLVPK